MEFNAKEHLDNLLKLIKTNHFTDNITILTGDNGSGKSLVRKIISEKIRKELEENGELVDMNHLVSAVSMEKRTYDDPMWGGLNCFAHDSPTDPTSINTYVFIRQLLKQGNRFIVIDEPEIGMSEETQLLLCNSLNKKLQEVENLKGVLIITHSRVIVNFLSHNQFLNIEGLTEEQWLGRELKLPKYTLEELHEKSNSLFREIENRTKKKDEG